MAVDDLWRKKGPDGKPVPSARDGRGLRYRVRWTDPEGKAKQKLFALKGAAERYDLKVRGDVARGDYVDPTAQKQTFREYAERWRLAQPHRPNTVIRVRSHLEKHIYPAMGARALVAVRPSDVQAFVATLSLTLKPGSVGVILTTVTAVFRAAKRDRLIAHLPTEGVKLPQAELVRVVPLSVEEVDALISALPIEYQALGIVAAGTGMRQGEVFGLQVRDVDFLRKTVQVERQVQPTGVGPLKNRAAYRTIPVGSVVIDALAAHLAASPAKGEQFVFRTAAGEPLHVQRFIETWRTARRAAAAKAKVPRLLEAGMHDLRHHYASALIQAGLSVKVVSERLGHTNAAMTLNTYTHLFPNDEDRSRQAIDDMWTALLKRRQQKPA